MNWESRSWPTRIKWNDVGGVEHCSSGYMSNWKKQETADAGRFQFSKYWYSFLCVALGMIQKAPMKPVSHWGWFAVLWLGRARVRVWDLRLDAQLATFLSSGYSGSVTVPVSHKFPTVGPCEVGQDGALVLHGLMAEYLAELDPLQAEVKAQWATAASALRFFVSLLVRRCFFSLLSCHSCWHCDKPGFGSV